MDEIFCTWQVNCMQDNHEQEIVCKMTMNRKQTKFRKKYSAGMHGW